MVLKMFSKASGFESTPGHENEEPTLDQQRIAKLETNLNDLGGEVLKLRQEVNTLLARQHTFKMALKRLREYLEERGQRDEVAEDVGASFQDVAHEGEEEVSGENGEGMVRAKFASKLH